MTIRIADRVFETTTTTGTGAYQLAGAAPGFRSFVAGAGNGQKVLYSVDQRDTNGVIVAWEEGIGTVTAGTPDSLSRTTIKASSNSGAAVSWGAGTKNVRLSLIASNAVIRDENGNFIEGFGNLSGTATAITVTYPAGLIPTAYSDGMEISGFVPATNTGAMTANVNGLGARAVQIKGAALVGGEMPIGAYFEMKYKASANAFELIEPIILPSKSEFQAVAQRISNADTTLALSDSGGHVYRAQADTTPRTWTIPDNATVAFPVGRLVTLINDGASGDISIPISGTDVLVFAGDNVTGTRTLKPGGMATLVKVTSTRWFISGAGLE